MTDTAPIPIKSRWRRIDAGPHGNVCRVMGEVENYIVARFTSTAPFLLHRNDWRRRFEEIADD